MTKNFVQEIESLNVETGEIIKQSTMARTSRCDEPNYVKLYIRAWCSFKEIKGINMAFLLELLPSMTYANKGQIIYVNSALKRAIAKKLKWSDKTAVNRASNELQKLCQEGILKKIEIGAYQVNPELIGKGEWADIQFMIGAFHVNDGRVTISYEDHIITENKETD